ncbi:winged helix-turn-helix domain-containing protein [Alteribacter natronophilus]|uniref:winged helix-turn-helix domain-containing protein n=1 Tax=Alteribacter natronophilus TaxID=2583810 RepID=UPI00148697D3|nr:winged helix-turn-helix domain-containing protein [Alteribacter natronophilus]
MQFSNSDYTVIVDGVTVSLRRKEYYLLAHLYRHAGRTFSRDALLDAVWPLEAPTDRTVDDHIYRLRQKLKPFSDTVQIRTVKGLGYSLVLKEESPAPFPEELSRQTGQLFNMYYKYGQGKALKELLNSRELGSAFTRQHRLVGFLLNSDFTTLLEQAEQDEFTFLPLFLYSHLEEDADAAIDLIERTLEKKASLDEVEAMDLRYFTLPLLYLRAGKPDPAMKLVKAGLEKADSEDHSFYPLLRIMKAAVLFYNGETSLFTEELACVSSLLETRPYMREKAALMLLDGIGETAAGRVKEGKARIDESLEVIRRSGHTYYNLFLFQLIDLLLPRAGATAGTVRYFRKKKDDYYGSAHLNELKTEIKKRAEFFL